MLPNMSHQFIGSNPFHHLGVNLAVALQKAENNAFSSSTSSSPALASASKVRFVNLYFALQFACFQLRHMIDCFAQSLIDASNYLVIHAQIARHTICRLLLVEAGNDAYLLAQPFRGFLFSTALALAFDISTPRSVYLERTAENTLSTPQKVGRTVENVISSSNHKDILAPRGYEIH